MVLPSRRSMGSQDDIPSEVHIPERKRSASAAFPDTPHPQKRHHDDDECRDDDTPPTEDTAVDNSLEQNQTTEYDETVLVSEMESPRRNDDEEQEQQNDDYDVDLDWDKLAESEPARTDIPIFLDAMARKEAAKERFAAALDEAHSSLMQSVDAILQTLADVHNAQIHRMEAMEADIKHNLVCNDQARAQMQVRLQESATAAQGLFAKLLQRVTEPLQMATSRMQEAMMPSEQHQQQLEQSAYE